MTESTQSERMRTSNRELAERWAIDVHQDVAAVPLEQINPAHPQLFAANRILPYFARLRQEAPVHWCSDSQFGPYWSITRFQDIMEVEQNDRVFSSDIAYGGIQLGGRAEPNPDPNFHLPMFIMADGAKHRDQRTTVAPAFTRRYLSNLEALIRQRAGDILDALPRNEEFNWVRSVSVELTGQMLATLFDIPQEDRHKLIHWSDATQSLGDPECV